MGGEDWVGNYQDTGVFEAEVIVKIRGTGYEDVNVKM